MQHTTVDSIFKKCWFICERQMSLWHEPKKLEDQQVVDDQSQFIINAKEHNDTLVVIRSETIKVNVYKIWKGLILYNIKIFIYTYLVLKLNMIMQG